MAAAVGLAVSPMAAIEVFEEESGPRPLLAIARVPRVDLEDPVPFA